MTQQLIQKNFGGTALTLNNTTTPAFTLKNLASAAYRQSAKIDLMGSGLGSPNNPAQEYEVKIMLTYGSAPTAGSDNVQLWVGYSDSATAATDNDGGCSGSDASYAGYSGGTAAQSIYQLDRIGVMALDSSTSQQSQTFSFSPKNRYCYFVLCNNSAQGLANTDSTSQLLITAANPAIQPSA